MTRSTLHVSMSEPFTPGRRLLLAFAIADALGRRLVRIPSDPNPFPRFRIWGRR